MGFHIVGDHFYEVLPNTRDVLANYSGAPRFLPGIEWNLAEYEERAIDLVQRYGAEYLESSTAFGFQEQNYYFRGSDALMLYVMLRDRKPRRMVEIGQGFSTRLILAALDRNSRETGEPARFTSIDPYPRFRAGEISTAVKLEVIEKRVEDLDAASLLEDCDFLFVDSSHVFKFGSDVAYELNVLYSRLPKGGILHLHDIFSPYDYPRDWIVKMRRFWNEQYFLECFLMYNSNFKIHLPVHYLCTDSERFRTAQQGLKLPENFAGRGASFYLRRAETT